MVMAVLADTRRKVAAVRTSSRSRSGKPFSNLNTGEDGRLSACGAGMTVSPKVLAIGELPFQEKDNTQVSRRAANI